MRWLITLISAGRNRSVMIRRELPRTRDAGWVRGLDRIEDRRELLSVSSHPIVCAAFCMRWIGPPLLNRAARPENASDLFGGHLVGLHVRDQINDLDGTVWLEPGSDVGRSTASGGITVERHGPRY